MEGLKSAIEKVILDPKYKIPLGIVKGFRNGAVYGAKIRFPHALVMTFLFRGGSLKDQFTVIMEATYKHSRNLAVFVTIYKTLMALQAFVRGKETSSDPFIAGFVGGYIVFGENNNINMQIVLYLFSRILVGLAKMAYSKQSAFQAPDRTYSIFAAIVWGIVMWLFKYERKTLQPSLQASMQYLYNDSNTWNGLRNFIWHNQ